MKTIRFLFAYAGVLAIPVYLLSALAARLSAPGLPLAVNRLSAYGNPLLNPDGAVFYNAGCVGAAMLLTVYSVGMYRWLRGDRAARKGTSPLPRPKQAGSWGRVF